MTHPYLADPAPPRVLAHRGFVPDGVAFEENTRAAVQAAIDAGAVYIESDCHATSDGEVVLFHDTSLARVAGIDRAIADTSLADLRRIMAPRGGLLTLDEAMDSFPRARFNLDVKAMAAADGVGRIIAPHADQVLVTSFSDSRRRRALSAARAHGGIPATSPGSGTLLRILAALWIRSARGLRRALDGLDALQIPLDHRGVPVLRPRLLDAAHAAGVEVHAWTINDEAVMADLLVRGVDGIVTDRTPTALAVRARHIENRTET